MIFFTVVGIIVIIALIVFIGVLIKLYSNLRV